MRVPSDVVHMFIKAGLTVDDAIIAWDCAYRASKSAAETLSDIVSSAPPHLDTYARLMALRVMADHCTVAANAIAIAARACLSTRAVDRSFQ